DAHRRRGRQPYGAAHHARAHGAAPQQPSVLRLPLGHRSGRLRARELQLGWAVARRRSVVCADRRVGSAPGRREVRRPLRVPRGAGRQPRAVRQRRHRKADDLCAWPRRRVLRYARDPEDPSRRRAEELSVWEHNFRHCFQSAVSDEEVGIMMITKRHLGRRTVLRGMGAAVALPLLDAMVPALTPLVKAAGRPVPRLGFFYLPNGVAQKYWEPKGEGKTFEFSPTLKSLEPFRDQVIVISGLANAAAISTTQGSGPHTRAHGTWLNGVTPKHTEGSDYEAGTTVDQFAAQVI